MIVGLIQDRAVSLTAWTPYVQRRIPPRFDRWLHHKRISVHGLYDSLIQQALTEPFLRVCARHARQTDRLR